MYRKLWVVDNFHSHEMGKRRIRIVNQTLTNKQREKPHENLQV